MSTNGVQIDSQRYAQLQDARGYWQPGGPGTPKYYFDVSTGAFFVDSSIMPRNGGINPIYIPDPRKVGRYLLIGRTREEPELPTMGLTLHEKKGGIPRQFMVNCDQNIYLVRGLCGDPSDFYNGWSDFVQIFSRGRIEGNIDNGARSVRTGDDPVANTITLKGVSNYVKGAVSFGEEAATDVVVEVIDGVFSPLADCANCGVANDGSQIAYVVTRANVGSPSAPGELLYTTDGGITWNTNLITGIGTTAEPRYIDIAGNIVFVGTSLTSLFYATISSATAAPGAWTAVTLPVAMTDVYVQSSSAIFFTAASGRIYRTLNITTAPTLIATSGSGQNLNRIHGINETIAAGGAAGSVYYSLNNGTTWTEATAPSADAVTAVQVVSAREWWVGTSGGEVYQTTDSGATWTLAATPLTGTGTVEDILFATREILYISQTVSGSARLIISGDGGNTFALDSGTQHIQNWPTFAKAGRLAAPSTEDIIAANYLLVAGLAQSGTDGTLLLGAPTIV